MSFWEVGRVYLESISYNILIEIWFNIGKKDIIVGKKVFC